VASITHLEESIMAKTATETPKRKGRAPAKLNISEKPGVGMAYVAKHKDENGKTINLRIATTCARDTNTDKDGQLIGTKLSNYTSGGHLGERYFTAKMARKGAFTFLTFLCSPHHKKCMGYEGTPDDMAKVIKEVAKEVQPDADGRICINGFVGPFKYEWTGESFKAAKAAGTKLFELKNGVYLEVGAVEEKPAKAAKESKPETKTEAPAKKTSGKKKSGGKKKSAAAKADAPKTEAAADTAKKSGAAKKPTEKPTWYGMSPEGKVTRKRAAKQPDGFFATKEEAEASREPKASAAPIYQGEDVEVNEAETAQAE
jgi:hypothetical protein